MAGKVRRVKIAPTVAADTIEAFGQIRTYTGESRGEIIDRLVAREAKRVARLAT